MSGKRLQLKRGTTAQTSTFTGLNGEVTVDTTKKTLVVHDGSTIGGTVLAKDSVLNSHTARIDNPHAVTKAQVGLGNANNTADSVKVVASAGKITTSRTISLSGDATGSVNFDGSANADIVVTVGNDTHTHAFSNLTEKPTTLSGYGITDVYTKTESNISLALKVNSSEKGVANGVATLDVNGKVVLTQIPDSVLGQLEYMGTWNFTTIPTATQKGQYWIASVSGNGYIVGDWAVWNGSAFDKVDNTDAVATVAGRTGNVVLTKSDVGLANVDNTTDSVKNVLSASKLTTARTVGMTGDVTWTSASFDGTGNVTGTSTLTNSGVTAGTYGSASLIPTVTVDVKGRVTSIGTNSVSIPSGAISVTGGDLTMSGNTGTAITNATLNSVGTAGTYTKVTTDAKGRVTSGTNPTTLSGYGITDGVAKVTSTDNAIVRFDGTTGNVQNSGVTIADAGNLLIGTTTDNGVDKLQVNGSIKSGGFTTKILTVASGSTLDIDGTMSNGYSFIGMVSIGIVDTIAPSGTSLTNLVYNVLNYYGYSPSVSLINQIGTCANVSVTWVNTDSNKYVFRIVNSRATAITIKYTAM